MSVASFAIAPVSIVTDSRLTLTDTRTLLGLLSFTTPDRPTCWPSRRTLAERIGVSSVSRISATLTRLKSLGWIEITHRRGSSVYRITPPAPPQIEDAPGNTDQGAMDAGGCSRPPRGGRPEQTTEIQEIHPLPPQAGGEALPISNPEFTPDLAVVGHQEETPEIEIQDDTTHPSACADQGEREGGGATLHHPRSHHPRTRAGSSTPRNLQPERQEERQEQRHQRQQERQGRIQAAQRLVARLNQITGAQLDTGAHSNATRRAARLLRAHPESEIRQVIETRAREFHHPAGILRGSVFEAIQAERRQRETADRRRRDQEREVLAQVRPVQVNTEVARAGVQAMRAALGVRSCLNS